MGLEKQLNVRLDDIAIEKLRSLARQNGVTPSDLICYWIREGKLNDELSRTIKKRRDKILKVGKL